MDKSMIKVAAIGIIFVIYIIYALVGLARGKYDSSDVKMWFIAAGITLLVAGIPVAIFFLWLLS